MAMWIRWLEFFREFQRRRIAGDRPGPDHPKSNFWSEDKGEELFLSIDVVSQKKAHDCSTDPCWITQAVVQVGADEQCRHQVMVDRPLMCANQRGKSFCTECSKAPFSRELIKPWLDCKHISTAAGDVSDSFEDIELFYWSASRWSTISPSHHLRNRRLADARQEKMRFSGFCFRSITWRSHYKWRREKTYYLSPG